MHVNIFFVCNGLVTSVVVVVVFSIGVFLSRPFAPVSAEIFKTSLYGHVFLITSLCILIETVRITEIKCLTL